MKFTPPLPTSLHRMTAVLLCAVVGTGCDLDNTLLPGGDGPEGPTMRAQVVAYDGSQPSLNGLSHMYGSVTLEGVDVELWDGVSWTSIGSQLSAATLPVGDAAAAVTLISETDVPTRDYSRVRVSASRGAALLSLTVDGQNFGSDSELGNGPVVFEKDVEVFDQNGMRTYRVALETVKDLTRHTEADGSTSILMSGDFGSSALTLTAIVASDGSDPVALGLTELVGRLKLEGISVELYDGTTWQTVVEDLEEASFSVANILAAGRLLWGQQVPSGSYTRIRLSAERAWAGLRLEMNGARYGGEALLGENVSVEKDVQTLELNGAQLFWMVFETVASVTPQTSADGAPSALIEGDFGSAVLLPPDRTITKIVASDGSDPQVDKLHDLEGKLAVAGLKLELWDARTNEWVTAVEQRDGARFHVGAPREGTPLVRSDDLNGEYTQARLSARQAEAAIALTLGDQRFRGAGVLGENIVLVKDLTSIQADAFREHDALTDHNVRVLWMMFETVMEVIEVAKDDGSIAVEIKGDFGSLMLSPAPPPAIHTAIVASDASDPAIDALHEMEGKLFLEGISLELLDGDQWVTVLEGLDHAAFEVGDAREATLLIRSDDIPDGNYTHGRLSARRASTRLALQLGDHRFGGHEVLGENVVVEREVEIIQSADGQGSSPDHALGRLIWMVFETVIDVTRLDATDGSRGVVVKGDFGTATLPEIVPGTPHTAIVASDASNPEIDALHSLKGKLYLEGISLALLGPDGEWRPVLEHLEKAAFDVAEPRSPTLLLRSDDIPEADYTHARLSIRRASAGLALHLGDEHYRGEAVLAEGLTLEKAIDVILERDAASNVDLRVLWMVFETVTNLSRQSTADGSPALLVEGEFGSAIIPAVSPPSGIKFEVIERAHTAGPSGIHERLRAVIRSAGEWEEYWNKLTDGSDPRPDRPQIDFEQHMVIVAAMGERNTGGYGIDIEEISESDQGIAVHVVEASPGADCFVPQMLTAPVTAVVTARVDGEVAFEEEEHVRECS